MKKILNIALLLMWATLVSSCLTAGLDDQPAYEEADITNVNFEYRWWDQDAAQMRVVTLNTKRETTGEVINCTITVPAASGTFTEAIRNGVSLSKLIAYMDISTAARIKPLNGAPALGEWADFSAKEFSYLVTAANGTQKEWTIKIKDFVK